MSGSHPQYIAAKMPCPLFLSDAFAHLAVLPQDYANKLSQHYRSRDASLLDDMPPLGSAGAPFAPTGKSNHKQDPLGTVRHPDSPYITVANNMIRGGYFR